MNKYDKETSKRTLNAIRVHCENNKEDFGKFYLEIDGLYESGWSLITNHKKRFSVSHLIDIIKITKVDANYLLLQTNELKFNTRKELKLYERLQIAALHAKELNV